MSLVLAGICNHGPGVTGRAHLAPPELRDPFFEAFHGLRDALHAEKPDAVIIVAAEHFANFFLNNMPSFAIGMADHYEGPVEDPGWLNIPRRRIGGNAALSRSIIAIVQKSVDIAYAEEWRFDHGIMVPLSFLDPDNKLTIIPANINCQGPPLTPLDRAYAFGVALRRAADAVPERIALIATGGISHWPATPDSGRINEAWDREFLRRWVKNDKALLIDYSDEQVYAEAGQGGFEIRTLIAAAAAARGPGTLHFYAPIPIFSTGCFIATAEIV